MAPRSKPRDRKGPVRGAEQKRLRVAAEAARIMAEEGMRDFQTAKRKAAARLSLTEAQSLPTNEEIDAALTEHLTLFHRERLARDTERLRRIAVGAMDFLAPFDPRLVGPVLAGTVTPTSEIQLHISADTPEQVTLFLGEHKIPFQLSERRVRFGGDRYENITVCSFAADGETIEAYVFDPRAARETPLSPIDGRPMRRAGLKEMQRLLQQG